MDNNEALVPAEVINANMAKLTITYNGQQGDLPDLVSYDSTDGDLKQVATESVRQGYIPGIDAVANADFTDFVIDRFPARQDVPFNRLSLRPKTPFGAKDERTRLLHDKAVIGDGVPMMSKSQEPLKLNDVVYSGSACVTGYNDEKKLEIEITPWRVIQLNYQDRYARVRNPDGCEVTVSFSEGCSRLKLYHSFDQLRKETLLKGLEKEVDVTKKKMELRNVLLKELTDAITSVETMAPPQPPVECCE